MSFVMLHFNHPLRSAERLATLDILSRGRIEFGTARGNNAAVVNAFKEDANRTKAEWRETLEAIANTPPAKAGGFGLRLQAGLIGRAADYHRPEIYRVGPVEMHPWGADSIRDGFFPWPAASENSNQGLSYRPAFPLH